MANRLFLELGEGKSAQNIVDSMRDFKKKITLVDIIKSFCYTGCGEVASELCARIISGLPYDTTGINFEAYQWALSSDSVKYLNVIRLQEALNVPFLTENKEKNDENNRNLMELNDYIKNYSDLTFDEYKRLKNTK